MKPKNFYVLHDGEKVLSTEQLNHFASAVEVGEKLCLELNKEIFIMRAMYTLTPKENKEESISESNVYNVVNK